MTLLNTACSSPTTPTSVFSRSVYERLRNNSVVQALLHICRPLAGMLKLLITGTPASLGGSPRSPRISMEEQSISGESSSTGDSVSVADAIRFKLIHYEAAEKVAREIGNKMRQKEDLHKAKSLDELAGLIERSAASLRDREPKRISTDSLPGKQDIGGKRKRGKLLDVFRNFSSEQKVLVQAGLNGANIPTEPRHIHIRTALASVIHGKVRGLGLKGVGYSIDAIDKLIFDKYVETLNAKPWNNISRNHALKFPDRNSKERTLHFKTTMTTAKNMDGFLNRAYGENVNGICSYATREKQHAVNLWRTEFRPVQESDATRQYEFSGLRHGVHDAYGIKNTAERASANDARVKEFIHAGVLEHLDRHKIELGSPSLAQPLHIDIVSVNLLTPLGKEKNMIEQQLAAFNRANGNEIKIWIGDEEGEKREISVKLRILMFSTPVNHISLSKAGNLIGIWRASDAINREALKALVGPIDNSRAIGGMAGKRLEELRGELADFSKNGDQSSASKVVLLHEKIMLIQQLVTQIRDIYTRKTHHRVGNEPYKLPTRLLALANEIGATPAFNCKSGKDRTGQLNVEIRDLYAHLNAEKGRLRDVDLQREGSAQQNYQQLFFAGGDREIQTLNTGAPGSKSQLPYYNELMGITPKTIDEIKGLSKWVGT